MTHSASLLLVVACLIAVCFVGCTEELRRQEEERQRLEEERLRREEAERKRRAAELAQLQEEHDTDAPIEQAALDRLAEIREETAKKEEVRAGPVCGLLRLVRGPQAHAACVCVCARAVGEIPGMLSSPRSFQGHRHQHVPQRAAWQRGTRARPRA
mgnify:CR=1 FL=1